MSTPILLSDVSTPSRAGRGVGLLRRVATNYFVRRFAKAIVTIWVVITLTFFIIHLMPGNPVDAFINSQVAQFGVSYETAKNMAAALFSINLKEPLPLQYVDYLRGLVHGNLGESLVSTGTPVSAEILEYLPWTLFCVSIGLMISFSVGCLLGLLMAYRRESWLDHILSGIGSLLYSVPSFLLAALIIAFLGVQWGLIPFAQMRGSLSPGVKAGLTPGFVGDLFFHGALPISVYVLSTIGSWMLTMKSSTISTLEEDYVTVARARGLPNRRIMSSYVGRNAILPVFTQLSISVGFIIGSSAAIEFVLQYQGIGALLLNAIPERDYTVIQAIFMIITIAVIISNLLADLLYSKIDPRINLVDAEAEA